MQMFVKKAEKEDIKKAENWDTWSKEPSEFPWFYESRETCLILSGKAEVIAQNGDKIYFSAGDLVIFEEGLSCTWRISEKINKKYKFDH